VVDNERDITIAL
jgi:CheY-like chemotaxis protein